MTKQDLIDIVSEKSGLTKKETGAVLDIVLNTVTESLKRGEKVSLVGFGTFEAKRRKARQGRNPATGETIEIEARTVPSFKAGRAYGLADEIAGNGRARVVEDFRLVVGGHLGIAQDIGEFGFEDSLAFGVVCGADVKAAHAVVGHALEIRLRQPGVSPAIEDRLLAVGPWQKDLEIGPILADEGPHRRR